MARWTAINCSPCWTTDVGSLSTSRSLPLQIIRYGVVGVLSNLSGYLVYLGVTWLGLEPKLAVSMLYPVGALIAYFSHARYSFAYQGKVGHGLARYVVAHGIGYGTNLLLLYVFHDLMHFPHQLVQAFAIVAVGGILFLLFRYFVFPARPVEDQP